MSDQIDNTSLIGIIGGIITGVLGSFVAFKNNKATSESKFRDDLLLLIKQHSDRISVLEDENKELLQTNQQLAKANIDEQRKQQEMMAKITELEREKAQMVGRIEYLENRLREVNNNLERILHERGH
jgi:chromosome segregation ATPase